MTTEKLKPLTKRQRKAILQEQPPVLAYPYNQLLGRSGIHCCGVCEITGIAHLGTSTTGSHLKALLHRISEQALRNCILMTDIRPRPDLEMLGFKLVRKSFYNSNTGNKIWMYTGLRSEITGGLKP